MKFRLLKSSQPPDVRCNCIDCRKDRGIAGQSTDLTLPSDVVHVDNIQIKKDGLPVYTERGNRVWVYHFEMRAGGFHESAYITIEEGMSRAHIEDIIGAAQERFVKRVAEKRSELASKRAPSPSERDEVAEVLKDLYQWRIRKREGRTPLIFS